MYTFLIWQVLQPFPLLVLLTAGGIANLWRKRIETPRRLLWVTIPFVLVTVMSIPALAYLLRGSLEWQNPGLGQRPEDADAIVVLSSGFRNASGSRRIAELDEASLNRCLRVAALYHQGKSCPVLVSGGVVEPEEGPTTCAELMRDYLVQLGVSASDVIVENHSQTTYENAVECHKLLEGHGLHKVLLVTDGTHLARALACFRKQGIEAIGCGCMYRATPASSSRHNFIPRAAALVDSQQVLHEWAGLAWYWLRGRI